MEKITRIHIAKVPYEASVAAQASLETYLAAVRAQLDADTAEDVMADIEVRITEILDERNIHRNGVITLKDVQAMQAQLGMPEQFHDETASQSEAPSAKEKRLLRDMDNAVLGGVAAGIAAYLDVEVWVVRAVFVVLACFGGFGILLYLLLWLLVPAATSSSQKLLMRGKAATIDTLRRHRDEQIANAPRRLRAVVRVIGKILRLGVTFVVIISLFGLLVAMGLAGDALFTAPMHQVIHAYTLSYVAAGLIGAFVMTLIGFGVVILARMWQGRSLPLTIAFVSLLGAMVLSLGSLAVLSPFVVNHYRELYGDKKLTAGMPVQLEDTQAPTALRITGGSNLNVSYVVTNQPLHASYQAYPGMGRPAVTILERDKTITVSAVHLQTVVPDCLLDWCKNIYLPVRVTIYGPALQQFTASNGVQLTLSGYNQYALTLVADHNATVIASDGYSKTLTLTATTGASIDMSSATAQAAIVQTDAISSVFLPVSSALGTLQASLPSACDAPVLTLPQTPTTAMVNGRQVSTQELSQNNCINILNLPSPTPTTP